MTGSLALIFFCFLSLLSLVVIISLSAGLFSPPPQPDKTNTLNKVIINNFIADFLK